ncbi:MAG: prephenate dehydrogenase/arogenate dehydrogenase family protein [Actinomycetota bacterium]
MADGAERVGVIGLGLIGGSIGLALRARAGTDHVVGFDVDATTVMGALERGAIAAGAESLEDAASGVDLVVVATPVDLVPGVLERISRYVDDSAIVTDVGSTKVEVVAAGERCFGERFVGGHPMAGSERHGIDAASELLFDDAWWIMTPTPETSSSTYTRVAGVVSSMGGRPVAIDPSTHDALVARLSHLPQLTASALVEVASTAGDRDALLGLAGAGFRDVTRIAASNPDLWVAIIRSNHEAVLESLQGLGGRLDAVASMISAGRWDELRAWLDRSRRGRLELFAKPDLGGEPVGLTVVVPDRPGVLAEVTTAAGELGANIEDLRIVHSTEGGQGRLELVLLGSDRAEALVGALMRLGYRVERSAIDI